MSIANEYERYMLELINAERAALGLDALQLELNLNSSAEVHSAWMLEADVFSHTGAEGSSAGERMADAGFDFSGSWRWAENIAVRSVNGDGVFWDEIDAMHTSLMNSTGHRANILNPDLDYIGIGIELGDFDFSSGTYSSLMITQNFASTGGTADLDLGVQPAQPVVNEIYGTRASEELRGDSGRDIVKAYAGDDKLVGKNGADRLFAGAGDDRLWGGGGRDRLKGGSGNDKLFSGGGQDTMTGGAGRDTFHFRPNNGADIIADFEDGIDTINLTRFGFAHADDALSHATMIDGNAVFDLGNGDTLTITGTRLSVLEDDILT